jgi:multimeric flavodoxin WrbA
VDLKAIVFSGCTRRNGNTLKLANRFLDGLKDSGCEVDFIDTTRIKISPCVSCGHCDKYGTCSIKDDMQEIYKKTEESDIIILTSPVYFASVTAQLKTLIDRFQVFYSRRYVLKMDMGTQKKGYLIFTCGLKNEKMLVCMETLAKFFMLSCNAELQEPIYAKGTDENSVDNRIDLLENSYNLGLEAGRG